MTAFAGFASAFAAVGHGRWAETSKDACLCPRAGRQPAIPRPALKFWDLANKLEIKENLDKR